MTLPIHVIIVGRNHGEYTRECLESVLSQDYKNFHITWCDDCSDPPDRAVGIAIEMLGPKHKVVQRLHRMGGLWNAYQLECITPAREIVFAIGGDDKLLRTDALSEMASLYEDPECWFTHGFSWASDHSGSFSAPALHDDFRRHPFHWLPCSWRSELTHKVDPQDLQVGGWWFQTAGDVALYTPILEMCGLDRLRCVKSSPSYLYRKHPNQEGAIDQRYQDFMGWIARTKPRYSRLPSLHAKPTRTEHVMPYGVVFSPRLKHGTMVKAEPKSNGELQLGPY